jgi:hypothetical protein
LGVNFKISFPKILRPTASGIMPTLGIGIAIEPYHVELENRIFAVLLLVVRRGD